MERSYLVNYSFEKTKLVKMLQTPIRDYRVLLTNKKVKVFVKLKWVYLKQRNFQICFKKGACTKGVLQVL